MENENKQELEEQDLEDKTGIEVDKEEETDDTDENKDPDKKPEDDPEKDKNKDKKPEDDPNKKDPEGKKPEEGDDKKDLEDGKDKGKFKRTVPYGKFKQEKDKRQDLQLTLEEKVAKGIKDGLSALIKADKDDKLPDAIKEAAKELAAETGLDEVGVEKILKKAKELAATNKLPKEITDQLKELDVIKKERADEKDEKEKKAAKDYFDKEWNESLPALKKKYPKATDEMIQEARDKMNELAHSKAHHTHDLEYIIFKNGKVFETILKAAPKDKSGEEGKQIGDQKDLSDEDEENLVDIEDITPEIMKSREGKEMSRRSKDKDKNIDLHISRPVE